MNSKEQVLQAVASGASNIRLLFYALRRVIGDAEIWDGIQDARAAGLLTYDPCTGALRVTRAQ